VKDKAYYRLEFDGVSEQDISIVAWI